MPETKKRSEPSCKDMNAIKGNGKDLGMPVEPCSRNDDSVPNRQIVIGKAANSPLLGNNLICRATKPSVVGNHLHREAPDNFVLPLEDTAG